MVDTAFRCIHDGLETNLIEINASRNEPRPPLALMGRWWMWWRCATVRKHLTHRTNELGTSSPSPNAGTKRQIIGDHSDHDTLQLAAHNSGGLLNDMTPIARAHRLGK